MRYMRYAPYVLSALLLAGCGAAPRRPTSSSIERCLELGERAQQVFEGKRHEQTREEILDYSQSCVQEALTQAEREERINVGVQSNFYGHYAPISGWETTYPNRLIFSRNSYTIFRDAQFDSLGLGLSLGTEVEVNTTVGFYTRLNLNLEVKLTADITTSVEADTRVDVNDEALDDISQIEESAEASSSTDAQSKSDFQLGGIDHITGIEAGVFFDVPRARFSIGSNYSVGVVQGFIEPSFVFYISPRFR